jgi:hypothetical protein
VKRILVVLLAAFGAIGTFVTIYAGRPFVSMSTSTQEDACSFSCSHFMVANSSPFSLHDVTVRCFPQKLAYIDEFTLAMDGLDTVNPTLQNLEPGESGVVRCGYILRHFAQPGLLLLSHGDPLDEHTKIIRIPVNDKGEPIQDSRGKIVNLPAMRGRKNATLGLELPLTQADVIFDITFTSRIVPLHEFHVRRRFELLMENGRLGWEPVPISSPPFTVKRTKPGFELQMAGSIDALESLPVGN